MPRVSWGPPFFASLIVNGRRRRRRRSVPPFDVVALLHDRVGQCAPGNNFAKKKAFFPEEAFVAHCVYEGGLAIGLKRQSAA